MFRLDIKLFIYVCVPLIDNCDKTKIRWCLSLRYYRYFRCVFLFGNCNLEVS